MLLKEEIEDTTNEITRAELATEIFKALIEAADKGLILFEEGTQPYQHHGEWNGFQIYFASKNPHRSDKQNLLYIDGVKIPGPFYCLESLQTIIDKKSINPSDKKRFANLSTLFKMNCNHILKLLND